MLKIYSWVDDRRKLIISAFKDKEKKTKLKVITSHYSYHERNPSDYLKEIDSFNQATDHVHFMSHM